jgi:hypothetical protein
MKKYTSQLMKYKSIFCNGIVTAGFWLISNEILWIMLQFTISRTPNIYEDVTFALINIEHFCNIPSYIKKNEILYTSMNTCI